MIRLFRRVFLIALFASVSGAWAQWFPIKQSLANNVAILRESPHVLVLYHHLLQDSVIVTLAPAPDADIHGGLEFRRGSNPYRVWITTRRFWQRPVLAEDGGRKFFLAGFTKALRPPLPEAAPSKDPLKTIPPREAVTSRLAQPSPANPVDTAAALPPPLLTTEMVEETAIADTPPPPAPSAASPNPFAERAEKPRPAARAQTAQRPLPPQSAPQPAAPAESESQEEDWRAQLYAEGVAALNQDDLSGALTAFEQIHAADPAYRDVAERIRSIEAMQQQAREAAHARIWNAQMDSLYRAARDHENRGDWQRALADFEELERRQPGYRDVTRRLERVRAELNPAKPRSLTPPALTEQSAKTYLISAVIAVVVLPLLSFVIFSSTTRSRYYLLRGNYAAAASIYEVMLARHPNREKLYLPLAHIYLLLGRRDEQAIKVYNTVLRLNLATPNQEILKEIVAKNQPGRGPSTQPFPRVDDKAGPPASGSESQSQPQPQP
ncbi:MAG: tetratricopeptide repeat protein [candidate division KSB1 bacterium]|nr:tetratricopeptide repeat protein [candidate division KSB1 bacterium]MDZ7275135.1 tetratricopeptide repeat protein [candidate division KSB1 bacterium]MDZ7287305.1 tetratricopeptide repeat protein [candidate division KSB1 bacterium]MDZ7299419.1 tetratricopeptide repeat protein [candidate division KSB1 bacterium]MDZ7308058.1 tetratricopeptide repeat protein [candidate division KSB1 bacterium]